MRNLLLCALAGCLLAGLTVAAFGNGEGENQGWEQLKVGLNKNLRAVHFLDKEHGWIVGDKGTMLATSDGAKSWALLDTDTSADLRGVDFVDAERGWIVGGGSKAVKGGSMFSRGRGGGMPGMTGSEPAVCLHTADGGKTWKPQRTGNMNFTFWGVKMIDAENGWLIMGLGRGHPDGHWNRTSNGGKKWGMPPGEYMRPCRALYDADFVDKKNGWCVGSPVRVRLMDGSGRQPTNKLYATKKGCVLHTSDGGETWEVQDPGNSRKTFLFGVSFVNEKAGWVVGEKGQIYHTADAGKTWEKQESGTDKSLRDVVFLNEKMGCTAGDEGTILTTTDGGKNWKAWRDVTEKHLRGISFPSKEACYVAGDKGTVLRRKFE